MNIYFDENMPFAKSFFSGFGNLFPFAGRELTADKLIDADVLLVRSITQVNEALLINSPNIKFVGTATIGMDHIDQAYLKKSNISFSSAPGCNAISVSEYVVSSLIILSEKYQLALNKLEVGIVGGGNTGSRLAEKLTALGIAYKICDPLLANEQQKRKESNLEPLDNRVYHSLEDVLLCDIISLHVPQIKEGKHPTYHLLNQANLCNLKDEQILISACRGPVIDNKALLMLKEQGHQLKLVLDVWEGEPNVLLPLVKYAEIATAHIAGYSLEGKSRGTEMLYQALCKELKETPLKQLQDFLPKADISSIVLNKNGLSEQVLNQLVKLVYDVRRDDTIFRQQLSSQGFDNLRKNYPVRREFSSVSLLCSAELEKEKNMSLEKPKKLNQLFNVGFSKG
ncbi:MAG: 4-phosphoerythronate dehydrogenase [Colwellia sp.]